MSANMFFKAFRLMILMQRDEDQLYLLIIRNENFSQNSEKQTPHRSASMKLCTQPAARANCQKIIDFSLLKCHLCMKVVIFLNLMTSKYTDDVSIGKNQ